MAGIGPTLPCSRSFLGSIFGGVYRRFLAVRQLKVIALLTLSHCWRTEVLLKRTSLLQRGEIEISVNNGRLTTKPAAPSLAAA